MTQTYTQLIPFVMDSVYPSSYNYLINKPHKFTLEFNEDPYILNLDTNEIEHQKLPSNWGVCYNIYESNDDGSIAVKILNYRNKSPILNRDKHPFMYSPCNLVTQLYYSTTPLEDIKRDLLSTFYNGSNFIINNTFNERKRKIKYIIQLFKIMYKTLFHKHSNEIELKDCHFVASKHQFLETKKRGKSMYLSLTRKFKDHHELKNFLVENHKTFIHDTIEYLIKLQVEENKIWIYEDIIDKYLDLLTQTHIVQDEGAFEIQFVIYSFNNKNFYYYSRNTGKFYKTPFIRFCCGKTSGKWTIHFGSERTNCIQEIDVKKLFAFFEIQNFIKRFSAIHKPPKPTQNPPQAKVTPQPTTKHQPLHTMASTTYTLTDLANKKNTELVEICAKLGLKKSGNKDDLIKRILLPVEERNAKGNRARKTTPKTTNLTNPTIASEPPITPEYLSTLTCKQLKNKCEALNMVLKGNKADLIARLLLPEHLRPIKHSKSKSDTKSVTASVKTELKTEDTGKIFEKAICLAYNTPYEGNYKYSIEEAEVLAKKLTALCELYPSYTHTGDKKGRYDFTSADGNSHLSAKTIKKGGGKVAPQVIGQASLTRYCDIIGITYSSDIELKKYMQENIVTLLPMFEGYTFDCPIVYYNKQQDLIRLIKQESPINWDNVELSWTQAWNVWGNSTTLKVDTKDGKKPTAILEIQFHSTSRKNIATRWYFENLLGVFKDNFSIVEL